MSPRDTARGPLGTHTQNGDGAGCVGRYTVAYLSSQTAATVASRTKTMIAIPATVRVDPARVLAVVLPSQPARRTRNLYPFTYDTDAKMILAAIAKLEADRDRARRLMFKAMAYESRAETMYRRKEIERASNYIRNGEERLRRLQAEKENAMQSAA